MPQPFPVRADGMGMNRSSSTWPPPLPTLLRDPSSAPDDLGQHQVRVRPHHWLGRLGRDQVPAALHDREQVSRGDLFALADEVRARTLGATQLLVAVMMWGYGTMGYGPARTERMLATRDAEQRIAAAFRAVNDPRHGASSGYAALADHGTARLAWLGPAFGTKFLYVAGHGQVPYGRQPLILDALVGRWIEAQVGVRLFPWTWLRSAYGRYLDLMHAWAAELGWEPDQVEHRVFTLGRRQRPPRRPR
jgi:hypothetical protein